ncbi:UrcA family protein [Sphingobium boeckii]|uniref:UrcA family protein n=1 Tax=Sphingobium boeckii TaxID=1082345 RepID=A0A7W9AE54_9SPHN|nr:UrcA family protein [Sphingobium boeckii]MBB5684037.1 UrcA family protein [Sphingobium boeckii]
MYAHKARAVYSAIFATAASLSLIAAMAPAHAGTIKESVSTQVSFRDLNLSTAEGVSRLNQRVKSAANRICGVRDSRDLRAMQNARTCRIAALEKAGADIQVAIAERASGSRLASLGATEAIGVSKR